MNSTVITKTYGAPPVKQSEALRYAGCRKDADENTLKLLNECIEEAKDSLTYKVCYCVLPVKAEKSHIDFGAFSLKSRALAKFLTGCDSALLFAATVGIELDRKISKALALSPSKAVMFDALGTERIEALCDLFCKDFEKSSGVFLSPRFSPGYGDLDIDCQSEIFSFLDCPKRIGLTVSDSMFMVPSKSVTAFAGIKSQR